MDVVVRSCRLWACSQKESCALQPCLLHLSCRGTLLFSVGLDLRGQRGNGDYVKKNWCEGVLVGVEISSGERWEAANGNISRNERKGGHFLHSLGLWCVLGLLLALQSSSSPCKCTLPGWEEMLLLWQWILQVREERLELS